MQIHAVASLIWLVVMVYLFVGWRNLVGRLYAENKPDPEKVLKRICFFPGRRLSLVFGLAGFLVPPLLWPMGWDRLFHWLLSGLFGALLGFLIGIFCGLPTLMVLSLFRDRLETEEGAKSLCPFLCIPVGLILGFLALLIPFQAALLRL